MDRVAQQIVDLQNSGRVRIVEPGRLHGRGAPREHGEPAARGVSGQVNQQVEPVGCDLRRSFVLMIDPMLATGGSAVATFTGMDFDHGFVDELHVE